VQELVPAQGTCGVLGGLAGARVGPRRSPPQGRVDCCYRGDATVQVATPPTFNEFRGGIIGVILE